MDERIQFFTDTATLAIFDPKVLVDRISGGCDWWCSDFISISEVYEGKISLISLGGDGGYIVRVTDGELLPVERDYAKMRIDSLGVVSTSGSVFVGKGECLPGEGFEATSENIESGEGSFIDLSPGEYDLDIFLVDWFNSPDYWNSDYKTPDNAPADIVILIREREREFQASQQEPRLVSDSDRFLFDSSNRVVGPVPGMVLETKVWKGQNGLTLKECGPLNYKPKADDFSNMQWKDTVEIKVLSVDHDNRTMNVTYLSTLKSGLEK